MPPAPENPLLTPDPADKNYNQPGVLLTDNRPRPRLSAVTHRTALARGYVPALSARGGGAEQHVQSVPGELLRTESLILINFQPRWPAPRGGQRASATGPGNFLGLLSGASSAEGG